MQLSVTSNTCIWIYGMGDVGKKCSNALISNGATVSGFIDAKKEGKFDNASLTCYKLDKINKEMINPDLDVVIICLANGMVHSSVARKLSRVGFRFILYLPMNSPIGIRKKRMITRTLNKVLRGDIENVKVYDYKDIAFPDFNTEDAIIYEDDNEISVYMDSELLYVERFNDEVKTIFHGNMSHYDSPLIAYRGYIQSFDFFAGYTDELEWFWNTFDTEYSDEEKQSELKNRNRLYKVFESEHDKGLSFFEDAAPYVERNKLGYYNLIGGHHRTTYLLEKGYRRVPITLSRLDFDSWMNEKELIPLINLMQKFNMVHTIVPIPHPAFFNIPALREQCGRTILEAVYNYLGENDCIGCSVLDASPFDGYFVRSIARKNQSSSCMRVYPQEAYEDMYIESGTFVEGFLEDLFKLIYSGEIKIDRLRNLNGPQNDFEGVYDVVFAPGLKFAKENFLTIESLVHSCKRFMFWESDRVEETFCFLNENFHIRNMRCIHSERIDGKRFDFCVSEILNRKW